MNFDESNILPALEKTSAAGASNDDIYQGLQYIYGYLHWHHQKVDRELAKLAAQSNDLNQNIQKTNGRIASIDDTTTRTERRLRRNTRPQLTDWVLRIKSADDGAYIQVEMPNGGPAEEIYRNDTILGNSIDISLYEQIKYAPKSALMESIVDSIDLGYGFIFMLRCNNKGGPTQIRFEILKNGEVFIPERVVTGQNNSSGVWAAKMKISSDFKTENIEDLPLPA